MMKMIQNTIFLKKTLENVPRPSTTSSMSKNRSLSRKTPSTPQMSCREGSGDTGRMGGFEERFGYERRPRPDVGKTNGQKVPETPFQVNDVQAELRSRLNLSRSTGFGRFSDLAEKKWDPAKKRCSREFLIKAKLESLLPAERLQPKRYSQKNVNTYNHERLLNRFLEDLKRNSNPEKMKGDIKKKKKELSQDSRRDPNKSRKSKRSHRVDFWD